MATTAEKEQAHDILSSRGWTVSQDSANGWVVYTRDGKRVFPPAPMSGTSEPAEALIEADAIFDSQVAVRRDREARRVVDAMFLRGFHIRPRLVPGEDDEGNPIMIRVWDTHREDGSVLSDPDLAGVRDHIALFRRTAAKAGL